MICEDSAWLRRRAEREDARQIMDRIAQTEPETIREHAAYERIYGQRCEVHGVTRVEAAWATKVLMRRDHIGEPNEMIRP